MDILSDNLFANLGAVDYFNISTEVSPNLFTNIGIPMITQVGDHVIVTIIAQAIINTNKNCSMDKKPKKKMTKKRRCKKAKSKKSTKTVVQISELIISDVAQEPIIETNLAANITDLKQDVVQVSELIISDITQEPIIETNLAANITNLKQNAEQILSEATDLIPDVFLSDDQNVTHAENSASKLIENINKIIEKNGSTSDISAVAPTAFINSVSNLLNGDTSDMVNSLVSVSQNLGNLINSTIGQTEVTPANIIQNLKALWTAPASDTSVSRTTAVFQAVQSSPHLPKIVGSLTSMFFKKKPS